MKNFVVYNQDGEILRVGSCPDRHYEFQAKDGEFIINATANIDTQMVIDGVVVDKQDIDFDKIRSDQFSFDLRAKRNQLLRECDWTQFPDCPLTDAQKGEYIAYRQALRDLPAQYQNETDINNVIFPDMPGV